MLTRYPPTTIDRDGRVLGYPWPARLNPALLRRTLILSCNVHVIERVLVELVSPTFAEASESDVGLNPDGSASERPSFGTCAGCVSHAECLALTSCDTWGRGGWPPPGFQFWYLPRVHVCEVYSV